MQEHAIPMEFVGIPTSWEMEQEGMPTETKIQVYTDAQEILEGGKKKINPVLVADKILKENYLIYSAGDFFKYQDGVYKILNENEVKKIIKDILNNMYTLNRAREVMDSLKAERFLKTEELNKLDLLNLKNCLFDINTFAVKSHTPEEYSTIQLNVGYDPKAKCELWIKSLYEIFQGSKDKIQMLQEFFGLCLTKATNYEKALFCIGEGSNGKSVVMHVLQEMLGMENYSAVPLDKFKDQHYLADLFGRLANISIEATAEKYICDSNFKAIVSGDTIQADAKYKDPLKFKPFCKIVVALNQMPQVRDKSFAFYRRLLFLRFNKTFDGADKNENLKYEIAEKELDGIFGWSLQGLKRLRERHHFELTKEMDIDIEQYRKENNAVLLFVEEKCSVYKDLEISKDVIYKAYREWCEEGGYKSFSKSNFGRELKREFPEIKDEREASRRYWSGIGCVSDNIIENYDINDTDDVSF